jgi:IgA peptidase M64/peptidase M64-like protein
MLPACPEGEKEIRYGTAAALAIALATAAQASAFDDVFTGATLRVDYFHTGTTGQEHIALERVRIEGPWAGSRTQLLDPSNLGAYLVEVVDAGTNRVIYSRGFSSIYGEWESTGPGAQTWGAFPEAVRIPEPRRPFQLRLRKRGHDSSFFEIWATTIEPGSRFVDRAPVPQGKVTTISDNGDPAVRVDLLILGDGYAASELDAFHADAKRITGALFAEEPFTSRQADFNVRLLDTPSTESGVTRPRSSQFHETPLGTRYNVFDSERYVLALDDRRWRDRAAAAPYDFVLILLNERQYGGGGIYQLYATAAAKSAFAEYLAVHEFGHHFGALGDEYYTSPVAYGVTDDGSRPEPWEPNITALHDPSRLKWRELVSSSTALPTPWGKDAYEVKSRAIQAERVRLRDAGAPEEQVEKLFTEERELFTKMLGAEPQARKVGAFEGALYAAHGLYRPSADCIMFTRDKVGFCPVCRRAIERVINLYSR